MSDKKLVREESVEKIIHFFLHKDLQEHEIVCPHCQGTGIEISDNIYGIKGDTTHIGIHFPYKKQSLSFCKYCYNGVLKTCEHCGSILTRLNPLCCCEDAEKERRNKKISNDVKVWNNSNKKTFDERLKEGYDWFYCDNIDVYFDDLETLKESLIDYDCYDDKIELRIYVCEEIHPDIDASWVIENATDDMHDDAYELFDVNELQTILNDFFNKGNYYSITPNYKEGVVINELYNQ